MRAQTRIRLVVAAIATIPFYWPLRSLPLDAGIALACSCRPRPSIQKECDDDAFVFVGVVIRKEPGTHDAPSSLLDTVELSVERVYKGTLAPHVIVQTIGDEAACGVVFAIGERWLVFLKGSTPLRVLSVA